MSFQGYLDTIRSKTGKGPDDFKALSDAKGFSKDGVLNPATEAGQAVDWLAADFALGRGHAMAIYALLKGARKPGD